MYEECKNKSFDDVLLEHGYGAINEASTYFIIKYVDKKFIPTYWLEHTYGKTDYNEMPKLILYEMKQQMIYFFPLTFGNEEYTHRYKKMESLLDKMSDYKLNNQYIETFNIDLSEIKKEAFRLLTYYFKNNKQDKER